MNIVYISKYVVLPEQGSPTRQYFLSKYLSKINDNNVLLIGSRSTLREIPPIKHLYSKNRSGNLETVTLSGPSINLGYNWKRIWSWIVFEINLFRFRKNIKKFKPDIVIVSSLSILTFLSGIYLKRWLKVPLVIEIRDIYPLTLRELGNFSSKNPIMYFLKWVERIGYRNADLIVSSLPKADKHISTIIENPFKFFWLPMGLDPDFFQAPDELESPDINISEPGKFIVAYAGSLGIANALSTIFEVAENLQVSHPHIQFVFIGDGPLKTMYQEKFSYLKNLKFFPGIAKKKLPHVLKQADLLINTWLDKPIYRYGISPNKWMDYMYAGKPILVAFSGYKSIIEDAQCGLFIPAENKIELQNAIVQFSQKDKSVLNKMGNNGRDYLLKNLTYEKLARDYYSKLYELVNR